MANVGARNGNTLLSRRQPSQMAPERAAVVDYSSIKKAPARVGGHTPGPKYVPFLFQKRDRSCAEILDHFVVGAITKMFGDCLIFEVANSSGNEARSSQQ